MHLIFRVILSVVFLTALAQCQGARGGGGARAGGFRGGTRTGSRTNGGSACTGDKCPNTTAIVAGIFGGIFGLATIITVIACVCQKLKGKPSQSNAVFVTQSMNDNQIVEKDHFQSGFWSSGYHQYGRFHGRHSLSLFFDRATSKVTGQGMDDVGRFTIEGVFSTTSHRMGLTKKYERGTGNSTENFGHTVTLQLHWNAENAQFEGKWFVQTGNYSGEGKFELKYGNISGTLAEPTKY